MDWIFKTSDDGLQIYWMDISMSGILQSFKKNCISKVSTDIHTDVLRILVTCQSITRKDLILFFVFYKYETSGSWNDF